MLIVGLIGFLQGCDLEANRSFDYPETGIYGDNILFKSRMEYNNRENSLQVKIPKKGKLKIVITGHSVSNEGLIPSGVWYYEVVSVNNWAITTFDPETNSQVLTSIDGGLTSTLRIFFDEGIFQIDYYEDDSTSPSYSKAINVDY